MILAEFVFWLSAAGLIYIYVGYPLLVCAAASLRPARVEHGHCQERLSVVIAAFNEGSRIQDKLDSLFACHGGERIAEVYVGSDGSTDRTGEVVANYGDPRVKLVEFADRRGKPAVLNELVPRCRSPIVILTDARQALAADALDQLVGRFAETRIGVVSGELVFRSSQETTAASEGTGAYWRYEKSLRRAESCFRSVPGATGALYAIRAELFRPIPENTLLDDVVIPMQAIEQGYRCVLETGAIAWDSPSQSLNQEAARKRRTIAGCAQLVVNQPRWLLPWRNPIWWEFVSHKLARLSSPVLMILLLVANLVLVSTPGFGAVLIAQLGFYIVAAVGFLMQRCGRARWLSVAVMFVSLNVTTLVALWDAARGRYQSAWRKTA